MKFPEGELEIDFEGALNVTRLDAKGLSIPSGFKVVDFVVEEPTRRLLVELKDPSHSNAPRAEQERFAKAMASNELSHQELVPKARGSYCYLHLMREDEKDFLLVVFLGLDQLAQDRALLLALTDKIKTRLMHEAAEPWKRRYVKDCVVLTETTWAEHMSYPLNRKPSGKS